MLSSLACKSLKIVKEEVQEELHFYLVAKSTKRVDKEAKRAFSIYRIIFESAILINIRTYLFFRMICDEKRKLYFYCHHRARL